MSDKLIRDELLRSHRYQTLSSDTAKLLFIHLLLASDSLSNAEATTTALSLIMRREITDEAAGVLLSELSDHDLIRPYQNSGKSYVHIPRSRQRIRYLYGDHPRPPESIEDKQIKDLIAKVGLKSDRGQTQDGLREEKLGISQARPYPPTGDKSGDKSTDPWWKSLDSIVAKGATVGVTPAPGESRNSLYERVKTALKTTGAKPRVQP